ncbi:hypothetical protein quinque_010988 [Culex quinquefasciatus]
MEVKLIILLGCLLSVGVVFGHRNHGSHGSYGGWNQHGGGGHHGHHGHHRHHRGHGCPHVNFEVKVPEGLEISAIQKNPNVTMFGIELYVNREPAEGSQCDVCQNTTTVTYGKFIIEDTQVVIKNGDVLSYIVLAGEGSNVTRHRMKKMWVTDSIINKCNCEGSSNNPDIDLRFSGRSTPVPSSPVTEDSTDPGFGFEEIAKAHQNELFSHEDTPFECDLDPVTNLCRPGSRVERLSEPSMNWQREAQILAAIIDQMKVGCGSSSSRTNQLLLKQAPFKTSSAADLKNFVQSSLAVSEELQELTNGIRRVSPGKGRLGESTVAFEMGSYVDKQKVLYHARLNNMAQVVDYDLPCRH